MTAIHARARTVDAGINDCIELMTSGQWETGRSHRELAAKHRVSSRTVETWATLASRVVRKAMGSEEDIRARMTVTLENLQARALAKTAFADGEYHPAPDVKAAISAVEAQAKVLGLVQSGIRVDVNVQMAQQFAALDTAGKLRWLDERIAKLQEARARVLQSEAVVEMLPEKSER